MENMTDIIWYDTIDSTNSQARRMLSDLKGDTIIAARVQTAGRGQRGNTWKSEPGSNLTFSMVMKFGNEGRRNIPPDCQFVISEAVALGVIDFLADERIGSRIKWPNDIYVGNHKICGILIENTICAGELTSSIAGVGLNLNQTSFPEDLPNPVSLSMLTGREYRLEETLVRVAACILSRLEEAYSIPDKLKKDYVDIMYRKDEPHRYVDCPSGHEFTGTIRGISDSARLQVELSDGSIREFSFKEISYIIS